MLTVEKHKDEGAWHRAMMAMHPEPISYNVAAVLGVQDFVNTTPGAIADNPEEDLQL